MMQPLDCVHGYALIWNSRSRAMIEDGAEFTEEFAPDSIMMAGLNCSFNFAHNQNTQFAATSDWTGSVWADWVGLAFAASIPATREGAGLRDAIGRGDLCEASVWFTPVWDLWNDAGDHRTVTRGTLGHIAVAARGTAAYPETAVWLASSPLDRMPPATASAARRWRIGALARDHASPPGRPRRRPRRAGGDRRSSRPSWG